jgi:apolipoprotein N-acyltransferase
VSAALAIGPTLVAILIWKFRDNRFFPLIAAVLWVLAEEGRMWGFAALAWGAQSLVGPHFSAAAFGFSFTHNGYLLQLARFGGLRMLDFGVAMSAVLLAEGMRVQTSHTWRTTRFTLAVSLMLVLLALPLIPAHTHALTQPLRAVLITTQHEGGSLPREETSVETIALLTQAGTYNPDLIVFPEGHGLTEALPDPDMRAHTLEKVAPKSLIMSADTVRTVEGTKVRLAYDTATDGTIASYDKLFFMPLGEYAPYLSLPIFSTLRDGDVDSFLTVREHSLTRGSELTTVPYQGHVLGGLLCAEAVSPDLYHALVRDGADLLVNLSNQVWFRHSHLLYIRTIELGKLHAVQNGTYYLMASNLSPSFAIDPTGHLVAESASATTSVMIVDLH